MKKVLLLNPHTYALFPLTLEDEDTSVAVIFFSAEQREPYVFRRAENNLRLVNDASEEATPIWTVNGMAW